MNLSESAIFHDLWKEIFRDWDQSLSAGYMSENPIKFDEWTRNNKKKIPLPTHVIGTAEMPEKWAILVSLSSFSLHSVEKNNWPPSFIFRNERRKKLLCSLRGRYPSEKKRKDEKWIATPTCWNNWFDSVHHSYDVTPILAQVWLFLKLTYWYATPFEMI